MFEEEGISKPDFVEISTFPTDFNVTFGHITSSEIFFKSPTSTLLLRKVNNIIFPTKWISELPFLSAVQLQQNWAHSNNVNLLAAGANNPSIGCSGSGIYSGKSGALVSRMTGENFSKVLVHEVPKVPGTEVPQNSLAYDGADFENLNIERDQIEMFNFRSIKLPDTNRILNDSFRLCHGADGQKLCCDFEIDVALRSVAHRSVCPHRLCLYPN